MPKRRPTRISKSGLVWLSPEEYAALHPRIYDYQGGRCFRCPKRILFDEMEKHHHGERGMGGSRHNDVPWFESLVGREAALLNAGDERLIKGLVYGLCAPCHRALDKKVLHWSKKEVTR